MVKPPMTLVSIFCRDRETANVRTLAKATKPVTSMSRLEATLRPSRIYMATLARDRIRLWAAFSRWDFSSPPRSSFVTMRMMRMPMTSTRTAWSTLSSALVPRVVKKSFSMENNSFSVTIE